MAKRKVATEVNGKSNGATNGKSSKLAKGKNGKQVIVDDDGYEIIGGQGGEVQIGEIVEGVFGGVVRELTSIQKGKPKVPMYQIGARVVLGSTVLRNRIEEGGVDVGDMLKITRLEDGKAKKGQNAPKIYDVRVKRAH